jgi:hypothetical protein
MCSTVFNVLILFATSFIPNIDWAAHLGGLIGGSLLALWYFGTALGGEAWAYNAMTIAEAQRAVAANLRALRAGAAGGAALPALPTRLGRGASPPARGTAAASSPGNTAPLMAAGAGGSTTWRGDGRRLDGRRDSAAEARGEGCGSRVGTAVDIASDALCAPMAPVLVGCGRDAPRALFRGAAVAAVGLAAYFALVCALLGALYGGSVKSDNSLLNVCANYQAAYPAYKLRCPY